MVVELRSEAACWLLLMQYGAGFSMVKCYGIVQG